ncbi:grainyhead-like protein 1 homolog isoform X2 [Haliotis rubra]|uniref:grainyhead-like protein 1 homolog isoform X2 n=1 Tax=Haliotis rubra TaxID=36100 RepID=UPI001EE5C012|nr:grainyhead-like protein 1 homolog isoform X2 [Haliotis rubra]
MSTATKSKSSGENFKDERSITDLKNAAKDVPPDDPAAFFGHPLTAASTAISGEDSHANGAALYHEYMNLGPIVPVEGKGGEPLFDMRPDNKRDDEGLNASSEIILANEFDKYLHSCEAGSEADFQKTKDGVLVKVEAAEPSTCKEQTTLRLDIEADQEEIVDSTTSPCGDQTTPLQNGDDSVMINDCAVKLEATFDSNSFEAKDLTLGNEHQSLHDKEPALPNCPPSGHHDESPPLHPAQHQSEEKTNDVSKKVCRALNEKLKRKRLSQPSASSAASRTLAEPTSTVQTYIDDSPRTSSPTATTMNKVTTFANIKQEGFLDQLHNELPPPYEASTVPVIPMNAMTTCGPSSLSQTGPVNTNIVQSSGQYFQVLQPMQTVEPLPSINNVYNYPSSNYTYPTSPSSGLALDAEKQNSPMLERYVQQQFAYNNQYQQYMTNGNENYGMKSPDSGYQEPCLSPSNGTLCVKDANGNFDAAVVKEKTATKKRKSVPMFVRQYSNPDKACSSTYIPKVEKEIAGYKYFMETPTSTTQRIEEDRVTYLNKGQYYGLTFEFNPAYTLPKSATVKSVIMLVFREEKGAEEEKRAWDFWHGRQHSYKQRILDIDTKNSHGISASSIEEISCNAVCVRWNPREAPVKVAIAVHCLSTDFSNQKGVKGIPLHIQIDTYENNKDSHPTHRGYCQIKVFCDKGAERKTRDEERRKNARGKMENGSRKIKEEVYHSACDRSEFYSMADLESNPSIFNPSNGIDSEDFFQKGSSIISTSHDEDCSSLSGGDDLSRSDEFYPPAKRQRRTSCSHCMDMPKILLYVREQQENVFTALLLRQPTMLGLLKAIEEKYHIPPKQVKNFYKKSKGIYVNMDDDIVRHYSHESTFIIDINNVSEDQKEIILVEIDPQ